MSAGPMPAQPAAPPPFRPLAPGAVVALIAPAGPVAPAALARVPELMARLGYTPRFFPGCAARDDYLAGDDATRLADLVAAYTDPEVGAIFCLRGGYGSARLLPQVPWGRLPLTDKPLIGYSDITALHAQLANRGVASFHGPMPAADLLDLSDAELAAVGFALLQQGLVCGDRLAPALGRGPLGVGGRARGRLVGGNLSLIASLLGTPFALEARDAILFIEDIAEAPYRVDRLLLQLRFAGVLDAARGFVLGSFTGCAESPDAALRAALLPLAKPVLSGWPAGHGRPNQLLPLGAHMELDADAGSLTLLQDVIAPAGRRP